MPTSSKCGCNWGWIVAKAAIVVMIAGAIGLADVFVIRKKEISLTSTTSPAGPTAPTDPTLTPPDGNGATSPATPTNAQQAAPNPPAPRHPPADNMVSLEKAMELFQRMMSSGDVQFVDARNEDEWVKGRIPTAVCLPPTKFGGAIPAEVDQLSRSSTIVIYCGGGDCDASKLTGLRLQELGFGTILIFHDGFPAWERAGQAVEK